MPRAKLAPELHTTQETEMSKLTWALVASALLFAPGTRAAELIFPQNRTAFYCDEPLELALAQLPNGATALVEFVPRRAGPASVRFEVKGDGSTPALTLPRRSLAPAEYDVRLDGKQTARITISSGVNRSPMLFSQTIADPKAAGGNFFVGNAFSFGLFDPKGQPRKELRGRRSAGMEAFERAIRANLPTLVYMYWTGYVTHKPFGSEKSWPADSMIEATRLLNFHTAQRLRRYGRNVLSVGTLDEPGLSWGKTPAGGMASGFPNWDEKAWYAARGWDYTDDPASRPATDWMKYMTIRCAIMKEVNGMAKKDLKTVWPEVVFSTDLYAPHAIMDGTDPLNQQVNDVPSSHVFLDWGIGRSGALSGLYLEKAHDPEAPIAHAMNGQLFGKPVPQPAQRNTYHLMRNSMLAAGLSSNWWLNPTGMKPADLAAVNEPALRLGPLFRQMRPTGHDTAVLWSFTEVAMREKDITAREARKKTGEQIKLLIASLPDIAGVKDGEVSVNAYSIGGNYKEQVLGAHQALARAGYPAHILHERILPSGVLKRYRTLVIVGQTFELPADVRKAIDDFVKSGGKVLVDGTTKVRFPGAVVTRADWRNPAFRWNILFERANRKDHGFKNERAASYYQTNHFMDEIVRKAVEPTRQAMKQTGSKPVLDTDSTDLLAERHRAGEGSLHMVLNAHEKLPEVSENTRYPIYNYGPYRVKFSLQGIAPGSIVYAIEGADWKKAREMQSFDKPQEWSFEPGEMKLFLAAPRRPGGLKVMAQARDNALAVGGRLNGVKMPWPLTVTVTGPGDQEVYRVYRATGAGGTWSETFPLGANAPAGTYRVSLTSPAGNLKGEATASVRPSATAPTRRQEAARVFDVEVIRKFLAGKPEVVIAVGKGSNEAVARKLAGALSKRGVKASVRPEDEVLRKVAYPRVWNPYALLYTATGPEKDPGKQEVKRRIEVGVDAGGQLTAKDSTGKDLGHDWKQPNALVTITGTGLVDYGGDRELCFEPGVKLYFNARRQMTVLRGEKKEMKTTKEFRKKWAKPWDRLRTHVGAYQLPPQLPEAYTTDAHLILLGDSHSGTAVAALQASEILPQVADARYPGRGRALVSFAWSPFAVGKNVILVGASDAEGLKAGTERLLELAPGK
jgi:hypothetical protein